MGVPYYAQGLKPITPLEPRTATCRHTRGPDRQVSGRWIEVFALPPWGSRTKAPRPPTRQPAEERFEALQQQPRGPQLFLR